MYVSAARNGSVYFTGEDGIYVSALSNDIHFPPIKLSGTINDYPQAAHPFVAPDESYIIFDAQLQDGNADLFVSFRGGGGKWTKPVPFEPDINTPLNDLCAFVSRDGLYLFFSRISPEKGDIFWVDAEIIENMRTIAR